MVQPHPSLLLVLDIDESLATPETRVEVSRCYGYVGSTVVRPHPSPEDGSVSNIVEMHVKLPGAKYLREATAEADDLWSRMMERWLYNQFHTVGNQMQIYNRRQREEGNPELYFDWLVVVFEGGAFTARVRLNSVSSLPAECAKVMTELRGALRDRSIGEDVTCVCLPAPGAYEAQARAWDEAAPERAAAEEKATQEAAREEEAAAAAAAALAEENFGEAPDLAVPDQDALDEESWQAELARKYSLPAPDFDIDYSVWGVVQPDGSIRSFDSKAYRYVEGDGVDRDLAPAELG